MQTLIDGLNVIINAIAKLLPTDPFRPFINSLDFQYLGVINWMLPIGTIVKITLAWVTTISLFYLYQSIGRFLGLLGS